MTSIFRRAWDWWWRMNPGIEMADETAPPRLLQYWEGEARPGWIVGQLDSAATPASSPASASPTDALTPAEAQKLLASEECMHCGGYHARRCGRVKRMAGDLPSTLTEVEYWPDGQWDTSNVLWPEDLQPVAAQLEQDTA